MRSSSFADLIASDTIKSLRLASFRVFIVNLAELVSGHSKVIAWAELVGSFWIVSVSFRCLAPLRFQTDLPALFEAGVLNKCDDSPSCREGLPKMQTTAPSYKGRHPASARASRSMAANKRTNTSCELLLCRALRRIGLRFRQHVDGLPGKPDIVGKNPREHGPRPQAR